MSSLKDKASHGIKWSYISSILKTIMQTGYIAFMARVLSPDAFGLFAMANVFLRFGNYFSKMGLGRAVVQKPELSENEIKASFTFSLVFSLATFLFFFTLSPLSTLWFNNAKLPEVIKALSLTFIFNGLVNTSIGLIRRRMEFKKLAIVDNSSYFLGFVIIGISFGSLGYGVWSLVLASISYRLFRLVIGYFSVKHPLSLVFKLKYYKRLISFGSRISLISLVEYFNGNIDTIFIGRYFSESALGLLNRSKKVINKPISHLNKGLSKVLFPSFSKIQENNQKLIKYFIFIKSSMAYILLPLSVGGALASEEVILSVLGQQWTDAIPIFSIVAIAAFFDYMQHYSGILLEAKAELNFKIIAEIVVISLFILLVYIFRNKNVIFIVNIFLFIKVLKEIGYIIYIKLKLGFKLKKYLLSFLPALINTILVGGFIISTGKILGDSKIFLLITEIIGSAFILVILLYLPINKELRQEIKIQIENIKKGAK